MINDGSKELKQATCWARRTSTLHNHLTAKCLVACYKTQGETKTRLLSPNHTNLNSRSEKSNKPKRASDLARLIWLRGALLVVHLEV
jgi:hypothetical protein